MNLAVERGAVAHVGGDNGAGKTTFLRIVTGVIAPDSGGVRILGLDPTTDRRAAQRTVGFAAAGNGGLHARLTVMQHLDVWARIAMVPRGQHAARVAALIERFELAPFAAQRCDRISLGQRQRLRLAIAFVGDPKLVLLDEPLTSLDAAGRTLLADVLQDLAGGGGAVVWCSPERDDVPMRVGQALRLEAGHLVPLA